MVRIAIVEDDRHDREALKKCLSRYEKENQKEQCRLSFFANKIKDCTLAYPHKNTVLSLSMATSYERTVYFPLRLDLILI